MKRFILCLPILLFSSTIWSQTQSLCHSYYNSNTVNTLLTDHDTVWIGTPGGLIKQTLSGTILNIYNHDNSGLGNNYVNALAIDNAGNILVGTASHGLQRFDRHSTWSGVGAPGLTAGVYTSLCYAVTSILVDGNHIWVAVAYTSGTLYYYDGSTWTVYNNNNSILANPCQVFYIQKDSNTIWLSGILPGGTLFFIKIAGNVWTQYDNSHGLPSCVVASSFSIAPDHKVWFAGITGAIVYDGTTFDTITYNHGFTSGLTTIYSSDSTTVWVYGDGGLWRLAGTSWTRVNYTSLGGYSGHVWYIAQDHHSNIWLGTFYGAYKWNGTGSTLFDFSDLGIINSWYFGMGEDVHGSIYAATATGLSKLDNGNWSCPIKGQTIDGISRSPNGTMWIGSQDSGIYMMDTAGNLQRKYNFYSVYNVLASDDTTIWTSNQGFIRYTPNTTTYFNSFNTNMLRGTYRYCDKDAHGNVWFAGDSCLVMYNGTSCSTFSYPSMGSPYPTYPQMLRHDAHGGEYFESTTAIFYYNGSTWSTIHPNNDSTLTPGGLLIDHNDNLWVGSFFSLYERTGSTWAKVDSQHIFGGGISCIYEDSKSNTWIGYEFALSEICGSPNSIQSLSTDAAITIYPNPAYDLIYIKTDNQSDYPLSVSLINMEGQSVASYDLSSDAKTITVGQLPDGLYLVDISTANHTAKHSKLVISR